MLRSAFPTVMASLVRYRCSPHVDTSTVSTRVVLYHRIARKAVVLNPTGSELWSCLDTPLSEPELAERLVARHPSISRARLIEDTGAFVQSLLAEQLLEIVD
jgi:hypothetical protein